MYTMDASAAREDLYHVFSDPERALDEQIPAALEIGRSFLDLPVGFLTRIDGGTQEIEYALGGHELIQPGETCPLNKAYCRRTVEAESLLAVDSVATSSEVTDVAYETFGLGTYIGAKITTEGDVYGTVCFAARTEREQPFTDAEKLFLEILARLIGQALVRQQYERAVRDRNERLEQEKQRFKGIAENSFDILFRLDAAGQFSYVSPAVERVLGYSPADLTGSPFVEYLTADTESAAVAAYDDVLRGEIVEQLELEFLDVTGDTVTIEVNATPVIEDGDAVGIQGVGRDITARKARERELRMKTRAMDEAEIGISIADARQPENPLLYINKGFERLTGYSASRVLGENCRFLQGDATDPSTTARMSAHLEANDPITVEILNYRADETPFWNKLRVNPIEDDSGEVTHYLGFQSDVTDRKRTEQLVGLLNRVLRHNLRNDMNIILGYADLAQTATTDSQTEFIDQIHEAAEGLLDVSEQAQTLEELAQRERTPERIHPDELLTEIVATQRAQVPEATIDVELDTDLAVCAGRELNTAVSELVENALQHNSSSQPWVSIEVQQTGDWIELSVVDDGPGIDEMEIDVIATGQETPLKHGIGLGLWLVNWVVTRYGGSFQIQARPDTAGTEATIRLPAIAAGETVKDVAQPPTTLFR